MTNVNCMKNIGILFPVVVYSLLNSQQHLTLDISIVVIHVDKTLNNFKLFCRSALETLQ